MANIKPEFLQFLAFADEHKTFTFVDVKRFPRARAAMTDLFRRGAIHRINPGNNPARYELTPVGKKFLTS